MAKVQLDFIRLVHESLGGSPERSYHKLRDGAGLPHGLVFLDSWIRDARVKNLGGDKTSGRLCVDSDRECWELG